MSEWCCIVDGVAVSEKYEASGQTVADYDSRSLVQFCESHQLLLGAYELLCQQNVTKSLPLSPPAAKPDIKLVYTSLSYH